MSGLKKSKLIGLAAVSLSLVSCLTPLPDTTINSGVAVSKVNTVVSQAYFKVEYARYDTPGLKSPLVTCTVPDGSPVGTLVTCNKTVPEETLYFSKLFITFGSTAACKLLVFTPYAYLGSYSATFSPPWDGSGSATVDCSRSTVGSTLPSTCYNGAAREIVGGFPTNTSIFIFPEEGVEGKTAVSAPYEKNKAFDNTWVTNNLVDRDAAIAGRYVGRAAGLPGDMIFQDWGVYCMDEWYEPVYGITFTMSDQDRTGGDTPGDILLDDFYDWLAP